MSSAREHACLYHTAGLTYLNINFLYPDSPLSQDLWWHSVSDKDIIPQNMTVFFVLNLLYPKFKDF